MFCFHNFVVIYSDMFWTDVEGYGLDLVNILFYPLFFFSLYRNDLIKRPTFFKCPPQISTQVIFLKFNKHPALFKHPPFNMRWLIENYLKQVGICLKLLSFNRRENKNMFSMFLASFLYSIKRQSSVDSFAKFCV